MFCSCTTISSKGTFLIVLPESKWVFFLWQAGESRYSSTNVSMSFETVVVLVESSIKPLKRPHFLAGGSHSSSFCSELGLVTVVLMELVLSLVLLCWSSVEIRLVFSSLHSEGVHYLSLNLASIAEAKKMHQFLIL